MSLNNSIFFAPKVHVWKIGAFSPQIKYVVEIVRFIPYFCEKKIKFSFRALLGCTFCLYP